MSYDTTYRCPHCKQTILAFPKNTPPTAVVPHDYYDEPDDDPYQTFYSEVPSPYNATYKYPPQPPPPIRTAPRPGFWHSDGANSVLMAVFVGIVVLLVCWWYEWPGWVAAGLSIFTGVVLYTTRVLAMAPKSPPRPQPAVPPPPQKQPIAVELISEDKQHWIMTELNPAITQKDLINVARAVVFAGFLWTRELSTKAGLSQSKHLKLQDDLLRLTFLREKPNNANGYTVTGRGRRFFQEITSTY